MWMEATFPLHEHTRGEALAPKVIRRVRLGYRRVLADRVDALLAVGDPSDFEQAWRSISPHLTWNHRPSARRLWQLARLPMLGTIVEIGSYMGNSTVYLALAGGEVHAVDPHTPQSMVQVPWDGGEASGETHPQQDPSDAFLANLQRFGVRDRVRYHRSESAVAAQSWSGGPIRLLFIDGLHTFEAVRDDYRAWRPWLAEEHVVLFDDYLWKEVEHAVKHLRQTFRPAHFLVRGGQAIFSSRPLPIRVAGLP